jgi:uncharacterized protein
VADTVISSRTRTRRHNVTDQPQPPQDPGHQPGPPPQYQAPGYQQPQGYQQPGFQAPGSQQGYQQQPNVGSGAEMSPPDQRMWAMLSHLGGILFGFLAPLIIWLTTKERGLFVADQSKEALNFQITLVIGYIIAFVTSFIGIGILLFFVVWIASIVFGIIAGLAANKGENYRYPFAIRLVS